ncbi:DUF2064 domain-containing protein [Endozoicomonas sp. SCSIO W0465]|uniref:TIGR04282 family arsenosugar biosynthesis glycosyltransferase n=1 Tax=Endozoicomonas sp. SCSIO W0465 TaxID=2918516 RepID=UPI002075A491|nr:DUF2064 domain-containing protein [Endozoicomonas sp. SCSIO W0465]USE39404.1 DUF2064 domain-containing protein [Endozoicomonas sp. SCSIO W0465]
MAGAETAAADASIPMKIAVAIFAKTIGLSPVKSRLASTVGVELAEAFYSRSIACTHDMMLSVVATSKVEVFPHWALAEEDGPVQFNGRGYPALWTGEGDLGARLATISERLFDDYDGVVMIGSDSPQLCSERLVSAIAQIKHDPDLCIVGPAEDGGFYFFGTGRPVLRKVWESVTYSKDTTFNELVSHLEGRDIHYLPKEQDVDAAEDLKRLENNLSGKVGLSESQKELLQWLRLIEGALPD